MAKERKPAGGRSRSKAGRPADETGRGASAAAPGAIRATEVGALSPMVEPAVGIAARPDFPAFDGVASQAKDTPAAVEGFSSGAKAEAGGLQTAAPAEAVVLAPAAMAPAVESGDVVQAVVDESAETAQGAIAEVEQVASETGSMLASSYSAALKGMAEINASAVDAISTNSILALRFMEAMLGARSLSDAMRLQSEHARRQFDAVSGQAQELTTLAARTYAPPYGALWRSTKKPRTRL